MDTLLEVIDVIGRERVGLGIIIGLTVAGFWSTIHTAFIQGVETEKKKKRP